MFENKFHFHEFHRWFLVNVHKFGHFINVSYGEAFNWPTRMLIVPNIVSAFFITSVPFKTCILDKNLSPYTIFSISFVSVCVFPSLTQNLILILCSLFILRQILPNYCYFILNISTSSKQMIIKFCKQVN